MINDFENSQEYKKLFETVKKYQGLYNNIMKTIQTEIWANLGIRLTEWKDSFIGNPEWLKLTNRFENYNQEVRETVGLTEAEFEKKYKSEIERSEMFGKNGWVISEYSNPADLKVWEQLLCDGEAKIADYFEGTDTALLDEIIKELQEKYVLVEGIGLYYMNGLQAFKNEDYMTAAMYLLSLLDNRVNKLVDFPQRRMNYKTKYSNEGFIDQKLEKYRQLTEAQGLISKKIYFLEMYPSLIAYLNRIFVDGVYIFQNGIEPPYLNRNWLMHGKMNRRIERYECIQIFNALSVIEFVFRDKVH